MQGRRRDCATAAYLGVPVFTCDRMPVRRCYNRSGMQTRIAPMLAVKDADAAIDFYQAAFGAQLLWHLDRAVAGLEIGGAPFFLAEASPPNRTRSPQEEGFTTVRIELFVDDPVSVYERAVAAGATAKNPVQEYEHVTEGPSPIRRMLQGALFDPFGHLWLIGKFLPADLPDEARP